MKTYGVTTPVWEAENWADGVWREARAFAVNDFRKLHGLEVAVDDVNARYVNNVTIRFRDARTVLCDAVVWSVTVDD